MDQGISSTPYRRLGTMRRRRPRRVERFSASPSSRRSRDMKAHPWPCQPSSGRCVSPIGKGRGVLNRRPLSPFDIQATRGPIARTSLAQPPASRIRTHALPEPRRKPHRRRSPWTRAVDRARAGGSMAARPTLRHSLLPDPDRSKAQRTRIAPRKAAAPLTGSLAKACRSAPVPVLLVAGHCWPYPWQSWRLRRQGCSWPVRIEPPALRSVRHRRRGRFRSGKP
jgi:hypothetical protein